MSGGGRFLSMDVPSVARPGAYINFQSIPRPMIFIGERGTSAGLVEMSWYRDAEAVKVNGMDFLTGAALRHVGETAFGTSETTKHISLLLSACTDTIVMSANTGGDKAKVTIPMTNGELIVEAQKQGEFGNNIYISVQPVPVVTGEPPQWSVLTIISGHAALNIPNMTQTVTGPDALQNNDFVTFSVTRDDPDVEPTLTPVAGVALEDGTNGITSLAARVSVFLRTMKNRTWQVMGWQWPDAAQKIIVQQFVQRMRDENGLYVQVAMSAEHANHEAIINVDESQGDAINPVTGEEFTIDEIALMVASMSAGADIITSNTNTPLPIQLEFSNELENAEIIDGLQKGLFMFSRRRDGTLKVEQDINSLHTFTPEKNREFRKNNILRKLDEIGATIRSTWENFFMGNEINDEIGRDLYMAQIDTYFTEMQRIRALQNHGIDNLRIRQGNDPDAVVMAAIVQPTDAMERLFLTVNVDTGVYFAGETGPDRDAIFARAGF